MFCVEYVMHAPKICWVWITKDVFNVKFEKLRAAGEAVLAERSTKVRSCFRLFEYTSRVFFLTAGCFLRWHKSCSVWCLCARLMWISNRLNPLYSFFASERYDINLRAVLVSLLNAYLRAQFCVVFSHFLVWCHGRARCTPLPRRLLMQWRLRRQKP